eukprot:g3914.t1
MSSVLQNVFIEELPTIEHGCKLLCSASEGKTSPDARGGSTLVRIGGCLYLYGGASRSGRHYDDLSVFDIAKNKWIEISAKTKGIKPPAMSGHSAVAYQDRFMIVFGGMNIAEEKVYNTLYVLDTFSMTWSEQYGGGKPPSPRNAHSATLIKGFNDSSCFHSTLLKAFNASTTPTQEQLSFSTSSTSSTTSSTNSSSRCHTDSDSNKNLSSVSTEIEDNNCTTDEDWNADLNICENKTKKLNNRTTNKKSKKRGRKNKSSQQGARAPSISGTTSVSATTPSVPLVEKSTTSSLNTVSCDENSNNEIVQFMIVIGGSSPQEGPLADMFALCIHSIEEMHWHKLKPTLGPTSQANPFAPRELHTAIVPSGSSIKKFITTSSDSSNTSVSTKANASENRDSSSSDNSQNSQTKSDDSNKIAKTIFIYGGRGRDGRPRDDWYELNLGKLELTKAERPKSKKASSGGSSTEGGGMVRCGHVAAPIDSTHIAIFGGFDGKEICKSLMIWNTEKKQWSESCLQQYSPDARFAHSGCYSVGDGKSRGTHFYIFGGVNVANDLSDLFLVDISECPDDELDEEQSGG